MIHALDLVGNVAAQIVDDDRHVGIGREEVGESTASPSPRRGSPACRACRCGGVRCRCRRRPWGKRRPGRGPWWMNSTARWRFATSSSGRIASASLRVRKPLPGICAPIMPGSASARSSSAAAADMSDERQRGKGGEAAGMLGTNRRQPVVDAPAQRPGHVERLGLDPAERAEQRQHADLDTLAVHPAEMEIDLVEGLGERRFAHRPGLQHLDAAVVASRCAAPGCGRAGRRRLRRAANGCACRSWSWLIPPRVVRSLAPRRRAAKHGKLHKNLHDPSHSSGKRLRPQAHGPR